MFSDYKYDKVKDGWDIIKDVPFDGKEFKPEFIEFLRPDEECLKGEVIERRAEELNASLGQGHAEFLIARQHLIPKELRGHHILFPGTVWRHPDGSLYMPCIYHVGNDWRFDMGSFKIDWYFPTRLVRIASQKF